MTAIPNPTPPNPVPPYLRLAGEKPPAPVMSSRMQFVRATVLNAGFPERSTETIMSDWRKEVKMRWPDGSREAIAKLMDCCQMGLCGIMLGAHGPGKTTLATAAAVSMLSSVPAGAKIPTLRYDKAMLLLDWIKNQNIREGKTLKSIFGNLARLDLLVIDELHLQRLTDEDVLLFDLLMDARYDRQAATVLIANLKPEAFATPEWFGRARNLSRWLEWGERIDCTWPSFRKKGGGA